MIAGLIALAVGWWLIHLGRKIQRLGDDNTDNTDEPTKTFRIGRN